MPAGMASVINNAVFLSHLPWRTREQVWGDGFADVSLSTSLHVRSWSDVSDDELVFFLPYLTDRNHAEFGIVARVRAAYVRHNAASAIVSAGGDGSPARHPTAKSPAAEERAIANHLGPDLDRPCWATEAAMLDAVGHMLCEAGSESGYTPAISEALLASIHTGINAAYVYPAYAFAHELLAAGAWFGTLMKGRRAVMPELVAHVCIDCLDGARRDPISELLQFHAARLGGSSIYRDHARRTIKSGRTSVVRMPRI